MSAVSPPRYVASARWLHWAIFAMVAAAYVLINLFSAFPRGSAERTNMLHWHEVAGLAVLLLVLPRVWVRARHTPPPITPRGERWGDLLATVTHYALYGFLLIQPLLGFLTIQTEGHSVNVLGVTLVPALVSVPNRTLSHQLEEIHGTIGTCFYWVIGLHIAAVLWHHFVRRDGTLKRML